MLNSTESRRNSGVTTPDGSEGGSKVVLKGNLQGFGIVLNVS